MTPEIKETDLHGEHVDVTDSIEEYPTGKVFECVCGQDFGTRYSESIWTCPSCNETIIDHESQDRNPPDEMPSDDSGEKEQSGLSAFM